MSSATSRGHGSQRRILWAARFQPGEQSAFPQARLVALAECGTHAVFDAATGPCSVSEIELSRQLVGRLELGQLVLADRGFYGFRLWQQAAATGADLLWRVKTNLRPRHLETLADGSWLARIVPTSGTNRATTQPLTVRVIDYTVDDGRDNPEEYRLLTTILDPADVGAEDLAAVYAQRWEIETTFDELKTHQRGPRAVLRSKAPDLVQQEIWGHLCCHYAIRTLMADTAAHTGQDPDRVSFVKALRIAEAEREGWLGEVEGLRVSLVGAKDKLAQVDAVAERQSAAVQLGMPGFSRSGGTAGTPRPTS
ncbi:IS4 family transposase [Streptomyces sp. NPDC057582]|uniref:IS4 family transposase n=1 Tax=Streptomyces sp. NPDC057582 TaxID=3346174 RepID=UPI0036ABE3BE